MSNTTALTPAIGVFVKRRLITDVLATVKSGKDATVYRCRAHPDTGRAYVAVKIHRPMETRTFRNDASYMQGRPLFDARRSRAMRDRSAFGLQVRSEQWLSAEYETLKLLHRQGASVPEPIAMHGRALLMAWIGDEAPAPMLHHVRLPTEAARACCDAVLREVALWLRHHRVHGDLSGFNILYHQGRPVLIDAPQAVDPRQNDLAYALLARDLDNVARLFARQDVRIEAPAIAAELWDAWRRGIL